MVDFTSLVRPFGALDVSYPRRIVKLDEEPPDNVVLKVGADSGSVKTLGFSRSYSLTTYMEKRRKQKKVSKRHVMRIIGKTKDRNGNAVDEPDAWLDIERDDEQTTEEGGGLQYQETKIKHAWYLDEEGKKPNGARDTTKVIVIPPDADPDDPYLWFELEANDVILVDEAGQEIKRKFDNTKRNTERRQQPNQVRRVVHSDTPHDNDPKYAKGGIIKDYEKTPDTKDKDQYLDIEVLARYAFDDYHADPHHKPLFEHWQRTVVDRDDEDLQAEIDETEETDETYADDEIGPPYRLDAIQRIRNVKISPTEAVVVAVAQPVGDQLNSTTETSEDGSEWEDTDFGVSTNAASGFGKTVVCSGTKFIAFGKPRDGASCFIAAKGATIQRGVLDDEGKDLVWSTVGTLPDVSEGFFNGAQSCSFAGGAFFVSYFKDSDGSEVCYLAVSFDGENFQLGIKPWNGVVAAANGTGVDDGSPEPIGGNVAYDKENKLYVTTGSYFRQYKNTLKLHIPGLPPVSEPEDILIDVEMFDDNFMSSVSRDGISWSAKFDTSECGGYEARASSGIGGSHYTTLASNVTFGNGMFVAAASKKTHFDFYAGRDDASQMETSYIAAVLTSTNGLTWTVRPLPGAASAPFVFGEDTHSYSNALAVKFVRTPKNDTAVAGCFVAASYENLRNSTAARAKLYRSENGTSWELVETQDGAFFWLLSAINKSRGKVVKF